MCGCVYEVRGCRRVCISCVCLCVAALEEELEEQVELEEIKEHLARCDSPGTPALLTPGDLPTNHSTPLKATFY